MGMRRIYPIFPPLLTDSVSHLLRQHPEDEEDEEDEGNEDDGKDGDDDLEGYDGYSE